MDNPYQPPDAAISRPPRRAADIAHTVISALIAALCLLQLVAIAFFLVYSVGFEVINGSPAKDLAWGVFLSATLALGGLTLLLRRRVCVFFFATFLLVFVIKSATGASFNPVALTLVTGFLGYAGLRWKRGDLKGWPGRVP